MQLASYKPLYVEKLLGQMACQLLLAVSRCRRFIIGVTSLFEGSRARKFRWQKKVAHKISGNTRSSWIMREGERGKRLVDIIMLQGSNKSRCGNMNWTQLSQDRF